MNQIRILATLVLITGCLSASAQKNASGIKFSSCINHKEVKPGFYKGRYLVLDFWATWCGPCIASFSQVDALQKKYAANHKVVFASITAERPGQVDTFFHRKKDIMPGVLHLVDDKIATWKYFEVTTIPRVIVFAPSGEIVFDGRIEQLKDCMDQILKGKNRVFNKPVVNKENKWAVYQENATYVALTGTPDTVEGRSGYTFLNSDKSTAKFKENDYPLKDVIEAIGKLTSVQIKSNNDARLQQPILLYYKQVRNDYPEFDKGIFDYQYQNHMMDLLQKAYSFHCSWVSEKMDAYRIVIRDSNLLASAATLSTGGSGGSKTSNDKPQYKYVNQPVSAIAAGAEDELQVPIFTDLPSKGYDFELDYSTMITFKESLSHYGLSLEPVSNYEVKKLFVVF